MYSIWFWMIDSCTLPFIDSPRLCERCHHADLVQISKWQMRGRWCCLTLAGPRKCGQFVGRKPTFSPQPINTLYITNPHITQPHFLSTLCQPPTNKLSTKCPPINISSSNSPLKWKQFVLFALKPHKFTKSWHNLSCLCLLLKTVGCEENWPSINARILFR